MDKETLRKRAAARVFTELLISADEARANGRWAKGAAILEDVAQGVIYDAAHPEERAARRQTASVQSWLQPLAKQTP